MGTSARLAPYYDMQSQLRAVLSADRKGALQSLTDRELALRDSRDETPPRRAIPQSAAPRCSAHDPAALSPEHVEHERHPALIRPLEAPPIGSGMLFSRRAPD